MIYLFYNIKCNCVIIIFLFCILLVSCKVLKEPGNPYKGKDKIFLTTKKGLPRELLTDSTGGQQLTYKKDRKIHNPKYSNVVVYTTYYLNPEGKVYKQKRRVFKNTPNTGKPVLAIE